MDNKQAADYRTLCENFWIVYKHNSLIKIKMGKVSPCLLIINVSPYRIFFQASIGPRGAKKCHIIIQNPAEAVEADQISLLDLLGIRNMESFHKWNERVWSEILELLRNFSFSTREFQNPDNINKFQDELNLILKKITEYPNEYLSQIRLLIKEAEVYSGNSISVLQGGKAGG